MSSQKIDYVGKISALVILFGFLITFFVSVVDVFALFYFSNIDFMLSLTIATFLVVGLYGGGIITQLFFKVLWNRNLAEAPTEKP